MIAVTVELGVTDAQSCTLQWAVFLLLVLIGALVLVVGDWLTEWVVRTNRAAGGLRERLASRTPRYAVSFAAVPLAVAAVLLYVRRAEACGVPSVLTPVELSFLVAAAMSAITATVLLAIGHRRVNRVFVQSRPGAGTAKAIRTARGRVVVLPTLLLIAAFVLAFVIEL